MANSTSNISFYCNSISKKMPPRLRKLIYLTLKRSDWEKFNKLRSTTTPQGYSLSSYDRLKCIFVHIPKAAGISICTTLFGNLGAGHMTIDKYYRIFSNTEYNNYFKFTFVRNPLDRTFSAYNFLKTGGINRSDKKWGEDHLSQYTDINDFIKNGLESAAATDAVPHFKTQKSFLTLSGRSEHEMDFIGKFETMQQDFDYVCDKLELPKMELKHENKTTSTRKATYRSSMTQHSIDKVTSVYKEDFELLDY